MVTKRFEEVLLIMPLAAARVVEEMIPEETDIEAIKEIIKFARILVASWDRVWTLAEKRLEVIEEVERIMKSRTTESADQLTASGEIGS
ncbi:MAG: hypothetical protein ACXWMH_04320 [Syntrophales bacterium]